MSEGGEAREGTTWFHLFTYGTLRRGAGAADTLLRRCERVGGAAVPGTLYDIDGRFPALVLAGTHRVEGDVWRCPADVLPDLDRYEGVAHGLFRRVGLRVEAYPCWTYVAGPRLARRLTPARRLDSGRWTA